MTWYELFEISQWVIRLVMLPVVTSRRPVNSAMAWLLVIFFEPWIGLILFLLIGDYRLPSRRIQTHERLLVEIREIAERYRNHPAITQPELGGRLDEAVRLAQRLGSMPILAGNTTELLVDTDEVIDRLVADIDAAEKHVHLLFYIYGDDQTGRKVGDALVRAVERGVTCRLLVDAVGSQGMLKTLGQELRAKGVEVHPALPVSLLRRPFSRFDLRNHRKLAVIDGQTAYTGSQNVVDADYGRGGLEWHDMTVRLTGPIVIELQVVFMQDWFFETREVLESEDVLVDPEQTGDVPVQTLPSGPNFPTENYQRMVVAALYSAEERVVMTTPYFVPDQPLMQAIQVAALRGVRVDVVVPEKSDQVLAGAAGRAYFEDVLEVGARLFLYRPGLLHAKTISVDDKLSFVGTSNMDIRSFMLNFELNLLLYGEQVTGQLLQRQEQYLADSREVHADELRARPFVKRVFENVARLLSPLL